MKKLIIAVVLLALAGLLGWQIYERLADKKGGPRRRRSGTVAVEVQAVTRGPIRDVSLFTGSLVPKSYFVCAPKIAGPLKKLLVDIGDKVKPGQLIALIDDAEYRQGVVEARAELDVAKAQVAEGRSLLAVAQRDLDRVQSLRDKKVQSEAEFDGAKAKYAAANAKHQVALAKVAQMEASLKAAEVRLSYTKILASWESKNPNEERVVGERFANEGAMLASNAPIVSILDLDPVTAVIHIIERDYSKIRIGQEGVLTTDAFPGKVFTGKVMRVAPLLKETSRQARVEMEVPNPGQPLKPGMFVRARIEFAHRENAVLVPRTALAKRNGRTGVFLADKQELKARFVPVKVGIVEGPHAEVVEPPLSGWVITLGHHLLADGGAIALPGQSPGKPKPGSRVPAQGKGGKP